MDVELKTNNMVFKMKGNPMKRNFGISPAKVKGLAAKAVKGVKKKVAKKIQKKKNEKSQREIDRDTKIQAGNDAYDKVKYSRKHGSKLKDKTGWTKIPGTNTWTNDAYEAKKENRKATEAGFKAASGN